MIAVTGANGLLGSFIVRKLLERGDAFVAIRRAGSDTSLLRDLDGRINWRVADVTDPVALEEAFDGVEVVIHAAAVVSFNPSRAKQIYSINVLGTRNVVNACLLKGVRRLVHVSSVAALGRQKGQALIDETSKWSDSSLNSTYAETKYNAELEVFRGQEEGLSTVIVNPSVILAPADWYKSSAQLFRYVWTNRSFYIDSDLNYVDVRDVVEIILQLMKMPVEAKRFIVSAGNIPFIDFFRKVATRFGKKPPSVKLDPAMLKVAALVETSVSRLLGKEPLITVETARLAGTHFRYSNEKVVKTLKFEFQPIDATIDWCCSEYLNFIAKN